MRKQFLLLLLLPLLAFKVADWVTVDIDNRVAIQFPVEPEKREMSGRPVWVANAGPNARCMGMLMDFGEMGLDSAALAVEMSSAESFEQFREGILGQIKGSSLVSEKKSSTEGRMTFEFVINMGKKDTSELNMMYNKNVFVGNKMYSFSFYEKVGTPDPVQRNKFFNSIRLK